MFITDIPIKPLENKVSSFNVMSSERITPSEWCSFHNTINSVQKQNK